MLTTEQLNSICSIDSTGYHFLDFPSLLLMIQNEYRTILGQDIYIEPDSMDGQQIVLEALLAYNAAALGASLYNSFSPVTAQGVGLSRVVKINGIERAKASYSTAILTIVGQGGGVITDGVAIDTLNQKWNLPSVVTIPDGGEIDVTATSQLVGDISAAPNTINRIFTPTLVWQTVNNAASATEGAPVERDFDLRIRQRQSVADPSLTILEGSVGGIQGLPGVVKVRAYENDTATTDANGIPSHTVFFLVRGGDQVQIADEIQLHKTPGTGTYGDIVQTVYDSKGMPVVIKFSRPTEITIKVQVSIQTSLGWTDDYETLIAQAVADSIESNQIGDSVLITKLYSPAYLTGTPASQTFDVVSILIGKDGDPLDNENIPLEFDEEAICDYQTDVTLIVS